MKVAVFSSKPYDRQFLDPSNADGRHELVYLEPRLDASTVGLAVGCDAVCVFVNDRLDAAAVSGLQQLAIRLIVLRCAGFNNVDLRAASEAKIKVGRVPAYSPNAVAEHTFALLLALNRKIHRAYNRVRECNFSLDGLLGFDLAGKALGIVGVGAIGSVVARIGQGFGCKLLGSDPAPQAECESLGLRYLDLPELLHEADIVSLHCPLDDSTRHLIAAKELAVMKAGATLINTSRGAVLDTRAVIDALKSGRLGMLGIDVYEEEASLFFEDRSNESLVDDLFARLLTFPNVIVTGHQGFFTAEAMRAIADTTVANLDQFDATGRPLHEVMPDTGMWPQS